MYCRNCGAQLNEGAVVCLNCGVSAGAGNKFCPHCGAQPDPLAVICVKCGRQLSKQGPRNSRPNTPADRSTFGGAIKRGFQNYANFTGRATVAEYWYWILFEFLVMLVGWIPIIGWLAVLALILPTWAVTFRRLHDTGRSGWYILFNLIPLVGSILLIIWSCESSQPSENKYGPYPHAN